MLVPGEYLIQDALKRLGRLFGGEDDPAPVPTPAPPPVQNDPQTISGTAPADPDDFQMCGGPKVCAAPPVGHPLFTPRASDNATPLDRALTQAAQARQDKNEAQFLHWSQQALTEARTIPNGDVLAVPMVQADLLALDGNFLGASQGYRVLEASLNVASQKDPKLQSALADVKKRHEGVLAAGIGTAVVSYAQAKQGWDGPAMQQAQRLATACADEIYRLDPTERNLQMLLATYAQVGLDLRELRARVSANETRINSIQLGQVAPGLDVTGGLGKSDGPANPFLSTKIDPKTAVEQLQASDRWAQGIIDRTEAHLKTLIDQSQSKSPYQASLQKATALALMGNDHDALAELKQARQLFTSGRVPKTPENLATEITVLHRLVGVSGISYDYHDEVLQEARGLITNLNTSNPSQAALLTIENMELSGRLAANRKGDDQNALREGQMAIVQYCETSLGLIKKDDTATREAIGDRMFAARASVLEQDLGAALVRYDKDERNEAQTDAQKALQEFQTFATEHQDIPSKAGYREEMGRATLAQAHYEFRTGKIEKSIDNLKSITDGYYDSSAAAIVRSPGGWPHQAGIVGDDGNFRNTDQADVLAAIKTWASQLNKDQGRGLAMCGVGAGALMFGSVASGVGAPGGLALGVACAVGYATDRLVFNPLAHRNEISAAYRTGITHVTTDEALYAAGLFALNLASMFVGGAAGGLTEKAILAGGSRMGAEMTSFLIARGLTPGPWTRAAGSILLRESGYIGNSVAFQAVSSRMNLGASHQNTAQDYLLSWLFVRVMPMAMEANPGGRLVSGSGQWDLAAQKGINTMAGLTAVQGIHALAARDTKQISADRLGGMAIDFLAMHGGNRAIESAMPLESLKSLSASLDQQTLQNMRRIKNEIDNAPPSSSSGNWWDGGFGGLQPAFAMAGTGEGGKGGIGPSILKMSGLDGPKGGPYRTQAVPKVEETDLAGIPADKIKEKRADPLAAFEQTTTGEPNDLAGEWVRVILKEPHGGYPAGSRLIFQNGRLRSGSAPGGKPLRPPADGRPLTVGRAPDNDIVVSNALISGRHLELRVVKDAAGQNSLLLVDGAENSPNRSTNGILVNGQKMTGKFQWVKAGDRISLGAESFVVEDPGQLSQPPPAQAAPRTATQQAQDWNNISEDLNGIAVASNKGIGYKNVNEDRYCAVRLPSGKTLMVAIDGMGGHGGGDRAAVKARWAMQKAAEEGKSPREIMEAGHRAVVADNEAQGIGGDQKPGAVAIVVETSPLGDGTYKANFTQVGDADALVIRPGAPNPVIHHTSRPNALSAMIAQSSGKPLNLLDDGRLQRGQTLDLRMDRYANIVDAHLGGPMKVDASSPNAPLQKGDIILAGSDGFFENFGRLDTIAHIIQWSGARTPAQVRDVLMQEALIRQSLLGKVSGRAINSDDYASAYREVTGGQEPPTGWRGMYEPWRDELGNFHSYVLERDGSIRENVYKGSSLDGSNIVDHFKKDNVTLMVQILN